MRTIVSRLSLLAAAAATLALVCAGEAVAHGRHGGGGHGAGHTPPLHGPGSSHDPIVHHPVHGAGSSHNPIIFHPVHGPGSSHNPIVCTRKHPSCGPAPGGVPPRPVGS